MGRVSPGRSQRLARRARTGRGDHRSAVGQWREALLAAASGATRLAILGTGPGPGEAVLAAAPPGLHTRRPRSDGRRWVDHLSAVAR
jgi:hypothetical protein